MHLLVLFTRNAGKVFFFPSLAVQLKFKMGALDCLEIIYACVGMALWRTS